MNCAQISGGYITNSHFEIQTGSTAALNISGCEYLHVDDCSLSGTGGGTGAAFSATAVLPCVLNQLNNCEFINLDTQVAFAGSNGSKTVASNIALGCAFAVNGETGMLATSPVIVDANSPTTNQVEWYTTLSGTGRTGFHH